MRKTGGFGETTGFALPTDRNMWGYNTNNLNLLHTAELYRAYPDDGKLKTFIFGVHSIDFERSKNWCDLARFAKEYGNKPEEFWYATNVEIFDYEDAVATLTIGDGVIENPSEITLYITVDGERIVLAPHATLEI